MTFFKAHDRNRTGDLFLTKEVLCRLSYMGDKTKPVSINESCRSNPMWLPFFLRVAISLRRRPPLQFHLWSGKRDSNPRPSAWKADALPLSYSRIQLQNYGGEGRIRTFEGRASGFTARPLWPLGYLSEHLFPGATEGIRTPDPLITNQ